MDITLPLKRRWFEDIKAGKKPFEYRLNKPYWQTRIVGRHYDHAIFTDGYPPKGDTKKRIILPWAGYEMQIVVSDEWHNQPQEVFAIRVSGATPQNGTRVAIRFIPQTGKWHICHAKSYQNAFRSSSNGFATRDDAAIFATQQNCIIELHQHDQLQRQPQGSNP